MGTRTYARSYLAEVTETYSISDADLTDEDRAVLAASAADDFTQPAGTDEILTRFDADHEETSACDDRQLTITRSH